MHFTLTHQEITRKEDKIDRILTVMFRLVYVITIENLEYKELYISDDTRLTNNMSFLSSAIFLRKYENALSKCYTAI